MNATDTMVGWLITGTHDEDKGRIGYGQTLQHAEKTQDSFAAVVGRQIYMATDLTEDAIPYDKRVKWRSFSDDGEPGYDGVVHIDWLYAPDEWEEEHEDLAYNIDQFNTTDIGAVVVLYNANDIRRCRPEFGEYVSKHPRINPEAPRGKAFLKEAKIDPASWLEIYS